MLVKIGFYEFVFILVNSDDIFGNIFGILFHHDPILIVVVLRQLLEHRYSWNGSAFHSFGAWACIYEHTLEVHGLKNQELP